MVDNFIASSISTPKMFDLKILPRIYFTLIDLLLIFLDEQCWGGGWGGGVVTKLIIFINVIKV